MKKHKYNVPESEAQTDILPNKLGLKTKEEIEKSELDGFLYAYKILFEELSRKQNSI